MNKKILNVGLIFEENGIFSADSDKELARVNVIRHLMSYYPDYSLNILEDPEELSKEDSLLVFIGDTDYYIGPQNVIYNYDLQSADNTKMQLDTAENIFLVTVDYNDDYKIVHFDEVKSWSLAGRHIDLASNYYYPNRKGTKTIDYIPPTPGVIWDKFKPEIEEKLHTLTGNQLTDKKILLLC